MSTPMVKAILEDRKTMTRRVAKLKRVLSPEYSYPAQTENPPLWWDIYECSGISYERIKCPFGKIGDRLWVRETFYIDDDNPKIPYFKANEKHPEIIRWKPSIFMPRWACRIILEITNVRVERLQEITEYDAKLEGVQPTLWFQPTKNEDDDYTLSEDKRSISYLNGFANVWQKLNGKKYPWSSNPFVWVIEFDRI